MKMNEIPITLKEVDRVEVVILIDNFVDVLLPDTEIVKRPPKGTGEELPTDTLLAEHGLSMLISVTMGGESHRILFDTGHSQVGVPHNLERLNIDPGEIETIVMSHAHMDHTGALYPLLEKIARPIPLVVHPYAFTSPRFIREQDGARRRFPRSLIKEDLVEKKVTLIESRGPTLISDGMILVTGEVEKTTGFEKGMPNAFLERDGREEHDPVSDDQALVMRLKGKGLVIVAGCSHAGIVNTLLYAKKITGEERVHGVLGGFHLTGPLYEKIIDKTVSEVKKLDPAVIVPMHCTGRTATNRFSEEFPSSFILNSVGSRIILS